MEITTYRRTELTSSKRGIHKYELSQDSDKIRWLPLNSCKILQKAPLTLKIFAFFSKRYLNAENITTLGDILSGI